MADFDLPPMLVTGASGFIGGAISQALARHGRLRAAVRRPQALPVTPSVESCVIDLSASSDISDSLAGVEVVIHCAARVHVGNEQASGALESFRQVNATGTLKFAEQAAAHGVRRFIFLSSAGVNGSRTDGRRFCADDEPAPASAYALSKLEAEQALMGLAHASGMEVVIIRPPLVYGPGAPGNFAYLMKWLSRCLPLPLGGIHHNRRSLVALDNLIDLVRICVTHPGAANQVFLVSDGEDLSTTDLLQRLKQHMRRSAPLVPIPPAWLRAGAMVLGRGDLAIRLLDSLQLDIGKTCDMLGWAPVVGVNEGLRRSLEPANAPKRVNTQRE